MENNELVVSDSIKNKIYSIQGFQVMLDRDLAILYGIPVKVLNQAVKRNIERFPNDFMFQLTKNEKNELVTNCDHLKSLKFSYQMPYVFTEQGVASLSCVLKSKKAIEVNIQIMRAFVSMRKFLQKNADIFLKLNNIEKNQIEYQFKTDNKFEEVFRLIEDKDLKPKKGIFFDGQIFDAYKFISNIIKGAKESIILIDNYIDDSILTLFNKRKDKVNVTIFTKKISKELKLDLEKYNSQYPKINIKEFKNSHDRFLIIDNKEVYHFGASLKDLGKKWFAFSKFDKDPFELLNKLES